MLGNPATTSLERQATMNAIVLAAGIGRRMGALTARRPKCLLSLAGETLLERQLRLLDASGVQHVFVVVGYHGPDIAARVAGRERVAIIPNPCYRGNGSISSLAAARQWLTEDVLILNGDLVYEPQMLSALLSAHWNASLVVNRSRARSPHVPVRLEGSRVVDIGRHIPVEQSGASFCCAGVVRAAALSSLSAALERSAASTLGTGWSAAFARLVAEGVEVGAVDYEGPWWDINSVRAYRAAQQWAGAGGESAVRL